MISTDTKKAADILQYGEEQEDAEEGQNEMEKESVASAVFNIGIYNYMESACSSEIQRIK